jgi:hypothetical protein
MDDEISFGTHLYRMLEERVCGIKKHPKNATETWQLLPSCSRRTEDVMMEVEGVL